MTLKKLEVFMLIIVLLVVLILCRRRKQNAEKCKGAYDGIIAIMILIAVFIVIHFLFCYQIGFPGSVSQNNNTDLNLTSADWLGFLGGYLGFAGSLVMAYLVYRQSERINNLTLSEYKPSASIIVQKCVRSTDYGEDDGFAINAIIQTVPGVKSEEYYSYHCVAPINDSIEFEQFQILLFLNIVNNSKAPINNLSFKSLEIKEIGNESRIFEYVNRGKDYDPADGHSDVLPSRYLKRCILIENIPKEIKTSWMTLNFTYGKGFSFSPGILVSKTKGNGLFLLNVSEQIK